MGATIRRSAFALALASSCCALAGCEQDKTNGGTGVPGGAGTGQTVTTGGDGDGDGDGGGGGGRCEGPYGTHEQETLDPTLSWRGFESGETEEGTVSLDDYAICGGDGDTTAIVIQIDALWCPACRDVAEGLAERNATKWAPAGVKGISLVVEDEESQPADVEDAYRWRQQFGLEDLAVAYDPAYSLANDDPNALPQALIVDPQTMRIVARVYGNEGIQPIIDSVVAANQ